LPSEQFTHYGAGFASIGPHQFGQGLQRISADGTPMNANIDLWESQRSMELDESLRAAIIKKRLSMHLGEERGQKIARLICDQPARA
jgi:hypothetical protein